MLPVSIVRPTNFEAVIAPSAIFAAVTELFANLAVVIFSFAICSVSIETEA